jgi:oxygen-dependent protoporphyrinogen oxidase
MKIGVIGSGISGLTAAYWLQKNGHDVTVFEKNSHVGGRMSTRVVNGFHFDIGANFLIDNYKEIRALLEEIGLSKKWRKLSSNQFATYKGGKLYPLYSELPKLLFFMKQVSLKSRFKLAALLGKEALRNKPLNFYNLSESAFLDKEDAYTTMTRICGEEVTDLIADPFCSTFQFHQLKDLSEAALLALMSELVRQNKEFTMSETEGGMSCLPEGLAKHLKVHLNSSVDSLTSFETHVVLNVKGEEKRFDLAVLATTAFPAKTVYKNPTFAQKKLLENVEYASTINVSFKVPKKLIESVSYVMVPFKEHSKISEYSNESFKGSQTTIDEITLMNVGLHETFAKTLFDKEDSLIFKEVKEALVEVCPPLKGYESSITPLSLQKWEEAIPKYKHGFLTDVDLFLKSHQGENRVYLAGDYLNSPWTEGSCRLGKRVAEKISCDFSL